LELEVKKLTYLQHITILVSRKIKVKGEFSFAFNTLIDIRKLKSVLKMIEEINPRACITTDMTSPVSLKK
jgi:hypothetical protein